MTRPTGRSPLIAAAILVLQIWLSDLCNYDNVFAQSIGLSSVAPPCADSRDTLDTLNDWEWEEAFWLIVPEARSLAWDAIDRRVTDSLAVWITGDTSRKWWNFRADLYEGNEDCRVLAWRMLNHEHEGNGRRWPMREALVSVELTDALGRRRLVLALLDAQPSRHDKEDYRWTLAYPHFETLPGIRFKDDTADAGRPAPLPKSHHHYVLKLLPIQPRNDSVYQFLKEFDAMRGSRRGNTPRYPGFFVFGPRVSAYDGWIFLDGAVRVNTWKHVLGEAPTIFFPDGK